MGWVAATSSGDGASLREDKTGWFTLEPEAIIIQPTTLCNLNCTYCYLMDRKKRREMTPRITRAIASGISRSRTSCGPLEVVWHGGEPLTTGLDGFTKLLEPFESLRNDEQIKHVIQTNATLLNDEWCDLFTAYDVAVGVSIDGSGSHNRIDWRGLPVFNRIMEGIQKLTKFGIPFTVIAVVSQDDTGGAADILDFLADLGCSSVGINMEEEEGANIHRVTPSLDQARRFWRDTLAWRMTNPDLKIREVERLLDFLCLDPATRNADGKHDLIPTVGWNGDVVVLSPELLGIRDSRYGDFIAGNVTEDPIPVILERALGLSYVREFQLGIERCKSACEFFSYCQGSHAGNRYFEHGTFSATETEHCRTSTQAPVLALHDIANGRLRYDHT